MRTFGTGVVVTVAGALLIGCGAGGGAQHPPGTDEPASASVEAQRFVDHDDCPGGGTEIRTDDDVITVICDGEPGDSVTVDTHRYEEHADCSNGGVEVIVDGRREVLICDGEDGETSVHAQHSEQHDQCPAAGYDIIVDGDPEAVVCHGADGEDGATPAVGGEYLEDHPDCEAGGVDITVELDDADDVDTHLCDGADGESGSVPIVTVQKLEDTVFDGNCGPAGGYLVQIQDTGDEPAHRVVCRKRCSSDDDCGADEYCEDEVCIGFDYDCEVDDEFYGQIGGDSAESGGEPTTQPMQIDAGLAGVQQAFDEAWDDEGDDYDPELDEPHVIEIDFGDEPVEIESATVTAVGFPPQRHVWVEDQHAAIRIFRFASEVDDEDDIFDDIAVGQRVDFTVEAAEIYNGEPTIRQFSDWEVVEQDVNVTYTELNDEELDEQLHFNRNVRLAGQVLRNSWACGGATCHLMRYGPDGEYETVLRISVDIKPEECVSFLGPVSTFPGFYDDNAATELDADNFDWYQSED